VPIARRAISYTVIAASRQNGSDPVWSANRQATSSVTSVSSPQQLASDRCRMLLERLLARVAVCHTADPSDFVPWSVDDQLVGRVHRQREPLLAIAGSPFVRSRDGWQLAGADFHERSRAMAQFVGLLADQGHCRRPLGELYAVHADDVGPPRLQIDRAAVPWFGVRAEGVHLNGLVVTAAGLSMWVGRRARDKRTFPGHLDNLVAGGQPFGLTPEQTLRKECHEEAGMPAELAAAARPATTIHYTQQHGSDWKPDRLHCFDLELPPDFVPRPNDGEVEAFVLWSVPQLVASLAGDDPWKPNCVLVVLDCLLRRGALDGHLPGEARWTLWRAVHGFG
jgi:isopentenyldiphosphate isomerase